MSEQEQQSEGFLDRTLKNLRSAWQSIAGSEYDETAASMRPDLPDDDAARLRQQMEACLQTRGGEVSARARAAALGRAYLALDVTGRHRFLQVMAENFDVDAAAIDAAIEELHKAEGPVDCRAAQRKLSKELTAPRVKLLTQFNGLPEGVKFLVDMRAELLPLSKNDPALTALENDLRDLLATWFDVDFLELRRITWETASGLLLEKLIAYEAVHEIESWDDLKNRLDSDRRCFAYFHPRMPDEPLIFVEVALVNGLADNVQVLLDEEAPRQNPEEADTAIFYSISNAQKGLAGISFGNFLIKRVADTLAGEFPGLKSFATLSPVSAFRNWLDKASAAGEMQLTANERKALNGQDDPDAEGLDLIQRLLDTPGWEGNEETVESLRKPLMRLVAHYLLEEKRRRGQALDPVAHFHLSNGARMERLNWMADTSARGLQQSAGMMMNYLYKLSDVETNHEAYTSDGQVASSGSMRSLLRG